MCCKCILVLVNSDLNLKQSNVTSCSYLFIWDSNFIWDRCQVLSQLGKQRHIHSTSFIILKRH